MIKPHVCIFQFWIIASKFWMIIFQLWIIVFHLWIIVFQILDNWILVLDNCILALDNCISVLDNCVSHLDNCISLLDNWILVLDNWISLPDNCISVFDNCKVLKSDGCSQCNTDSSTIQNTLCSLHVLVRTSRTLDYFYSWYYNGTRMKNIITPDNHRYIAFSGKQDEKACNDMNLCVMEIHLQLNLPRPFSRFNYGNYTVKLGTTVEQEKEEVSCSTLVCANSIIGR